MRQPNFATCSGVRHIRKGRHTSPKSEA